MGDRTQWYIPPMVTFLPSLFDFLLFVNNGYILLPKQNH